MCGVVAALGHPDINEPLNRLAHRGIRAKVVQSAAGVMGHVRLPIVGLSESHDQPMEKSGWLIGFVGELLDFKETNPEYACDAELVRDTWPGMGPHGFTDRDGFWGIVCISPTTRMLHVLTDYLGQKPMYYRADFPSAASEPGALVPFGPVTLDKIYLAAVIKWGYCPDLERTPYNEIKHLLPGEHVVISEDGFVQREIVDPLLPMKWSNVLMADEIERAVKRRVLSSDVPVAALVSGGVDSAIVYTLAARHGDVVPYFVHDGAESAASQDYWGAVAVVEDAGGRHFTERQDLAYLMSTESKLKRCIWNEVTIEEGLNIMQEPIDLGSLRPQVALSQIVSERVCLTGDGADELFGGYSRSERYDSQYSDVFQELPAWHLPRLDRVMMRQRIEVRSPFLARRVAGMALSLPHDLRKDKTFLRSLFASDLPPKIARAPKKALRVPDIARDREYYSKVLVDKFVEKFNERR